MSTLVPYVFDLTPANQILDRLDKNFALMSVTQAYGRLTGRTAAVASVCTYTPPSDGTFEIGFNLNITTSTNFNFSANVTYKDETNTSQNVLLLYIGQGTSSLGNIFANVNGAVPYMGIPISIRAKGTNAITILTSGTFTTVTYNVEGWIRQIQ